MIAAELIIACLSGAVLVGVALDALHAWEHRDAERRHEQAAARRRAAEVEQYVRRWGGGD